MRESTAARPTQILAWKPDRIARNFDDGGKVIGMLRRGQIQEIRTFEKSHLPSDNVLMIAVELGMANQSVRDLSVNIQRGIRDARPPWHYLRQGSAWLFQRAEAADHRAAS